MRIRFQPRVCVGIVAVSLISVLVAAQQGASSPRAIDERNSAITIRVYKTGLFSAFAHNHEIYAPIQRGNFDEQRHTVELTVAAKELRVIDPDASASDRIQVQANMVGPKVLDVEKFPEIKFRSDSVEPAGQWQRKVRGDLTLHGHTEPVTVDVQGQDGHYTGSAILKQTDFGITPITIAGGAVKVKDEIRIEFKIFGK